MPTLNIEGVGRVTVDDSFSQMTPEQQAQAVEEITQEMKGATQPSATQPAPGAQPQAPGQQAPETEAGSFLDPLMQGVTLGSADEIKGALRGGARYMFGDNPGKSFGDLYGEEVGAARGNLEAFRTRNPWGSVGAEIGGAGLGVLATGGASLIPKAASTLGKIGLGALEGGALSGLYGFNAGEGGLEERAKSAARSAPFGAAAGAAAGGLAGVLSRGAKSAAAPALDELRTAANAAFQQVDNSGATITPRTSGLIVDDIVRLASKQRINEKLHPKAYAALQDVISLRGQTPTISDLHQVRQILGDAASSIDPADRRMASLFIDAMDNRLDRLSAFDVAGGDPKATVAALKEGMATWRRLRKGEIVARIFSNAEIDSAAKYTQGGKETALRNGFKNLAKNPKQLRGFTEEEVAAIRKVAMGGPLENVLRFFGKFAPRGPLTGGGLIGATYLEPSAGIPLWLAAEGGRAASTKMTARSARLADELIRRGAPARAAKPLSAAGQSALALTMGTGLPAWPMIERAVK
jgi:hypothetical protein